MWAGPELPVYLDWCGIASNADTVDFRILLSKGTSIGTAFCQGRFPSNVQLVWVDDLFTMFGDLLSAVNANFVALDHRNASALEFAGALRRAGVGDRFGAPWYLSTMQPLFADAALLVEQSLSIKEYPPVASYTHWGWACMDVLWGNIRDTLLKDAGDADVISVSGAEDYHRLHLRAQLTVFKNRASTRQLWRSCFSRLKQILLSESIKDFFNEGLFSSTVLDGMHDFKVRFMIGRSVEGAAVLNDNPSYMHIPFWMRGRGMQDEIFQDDSGAILTGTVLHRTLTGALEVCRKKPLKPAKRSWEKLHQPNTIGLQTVQRGARCDLQWLPPESRRCVWQCLRPAFNNAAACALDNDTSVWAAPTDVSEVGRAQDRGVARPSLLDIHQHVGRFHGILEYDALSPQGNPCLPISQAHFGGLLRPTWLYWGLIGPHPTVFNWGGLKRV